MVLWFACRASTAAAQDSVAAEALFQQAREAMKASDWAGACAKFTESQRLGPAVGTLLNLAYCSEKLGRVATAWQHYRQALDQLPPGDERIGPARDRIEALQPRLPRIVLTLHAAAP